jgi:hypothetical protein
MNNPRRNSRFGQKMLVIGVLAIGLACTCNGLSIFPRSPSPVPQDFPTLDPGEFPTSATQAVPNPGSNDSQGLNSAGPWLIISTTGGIWAANPDGSNLEKITGNVLWQGGLAGAIQPAGNQIVLFSSSGDQYHHLALNLLSLPDGQIQKITDLTTAQTEPGPDMGPGDSSFEAVRAIVDTPSYAWSPDGTRLAFIGVMDGPSADIYLYDTRTNLITRVSQDDSQDYWPSWSPDGDTILYFGAESFGTGAGYAMESVWKANGDGSDYDLVYTPTSSGEELVGWRDDQIVVIDSWNPICGSGNLRLYNVFTGEETVLQEGCFNLAETGHWGDANLNEVMFSTEDGLYLVPADGVEAQKVSDKQVISIRWDQEGSMFVVKFKDGSITTYYSSDGSYEESPTQVQDVTMYGMIWAWSNNGAELPGVWISGPGIDLGQIFDKLAYDPIWNYNDNSLFFFSGNDPGTDLYKATFNNYYNDATAVGYLTGDVQGVHWLGIK